MNTRELQQYMLQDPYISKFYGGVCARDQLPTIVNGPKLYIVNTDPISQAGEHWIVLWIDTTCEYFDSLGQQPETDFERFLILNGLNYKYNYRRLQSDDSNVCGHYSFEAFMKMFSSDLVVNDSIVRNFVYK